MKSYSIPLNSDFQEPGREDYRMVITDAWQDIHHSRVQEWSSLGVVIAIHVAIIQLLDFLDKDSNHLKFAMITAGLIGVIFAIIGIGITNRHRILMIKKMNWITLAEYKLGLLVDIHKRFSSDIHIKGVIPLENSMITKLHHFNEQIESEINNKRCKNYYGFKYIRIKSTSSLLMAFYIALILLDFFLVYYFLKY